MKRLLCVMAIISVTLSLQAAVGAVSASRGAVVTDFSKDSPEAMLIAAFSSPFSEKWIEEYLTDNTLFRASYTGYLASVLPLKNIILFHNGDFYTLYSLESGKAVSVKLNGMAICGILIEG